MIDFIGFDAVPDNPYSTKSRKRIILGLFEVAEECGLPEEVVIVNAEVAYADGFVPPEGRPWIAVGSVRTQTDMLNLKNKGASGAFAVRYLYEGQPDFDSEEKKNMRIQFENALSMSGIKER